MAITLEAARINAGYSLKQASRFIGVTPSALSNYESGIRDIPGSKLQILIFKYHISFDEVILKNKHGEKVEVR